MRWAVCNLQKFNLSLLAKWWRKPVENHSSALVFILKHNITIVVRPSIWMPPFHLKPPLLGKASSDLLPSSKRSIYLYAELVTSFSFGVTNGLVQNSLLTNSIFDIAWDLTIETALRLSLGASLEDYSLTPSGGSAKKKRLIYFKSLAQWTP